MSDDKCGPTCRILPDQGWDDVALQMDSFLTGAIRAISDEYAIESVPWLEINRWPDSGRLIVFPSLDGPHGDRNERICCQLISEFLEREWTRIGDGPVEEQEQAWGALGRMVWDCVRNCLCNGDAGRALEIARGSHRFRLATYDYEFGEGLFHLPEIDPDAHAEMKQRLVEFKKRIGAIA